MALGLLGGVGEFGWSGIAEAIEAMSPAPLGPGHPLQRVLSLSSRYTSSKYF